MMTKTDEILEFENEDTSLKDEIKEMWVEKKLDEKQLLKELNDFAEQIKNELGPTIKNELFNSIQLKPIKKTWWQNIFNNVNNLCNYVNSWCVYNFICKY